MTNKPFSLFKGATRTPTYLGIPLTPLLCSIIGVSGTSMLLGNIWIFLAAPVILSIMAQITKHDDKAFHILFLWFKTKCMNKNKKFWEASSYSPCHYCQSNTHKPFGGLTTLDRKICGS